MTIETVCANCGENISVYPSHYRERGNNFCDNECYLEYKRQDQIETTCDQCGDDVHVTPSEQHLDHHFCDQECHSKFRMTRKEVPCDECGDLVEKHEHRIEEYDNVFCSRECSDEFRRTGQDYECENCGEIVYRHPSAVGDSVFCSDDCYQEWNVGDNHHAWSEVTVRCWWCGDEVLKKPTRAERTKRHFCDMSCSGNWRSWNNMYPQDPEPDRDIPKWLWDERIKSASQPPNVQELEDRTGHYSQTDTERGRDD